MSELTAIQASINKRVIIGLSAIGVMVLLAFVFFYSAIDELDLDANTINVSGSQRMNANRILLKMHIVKELKASGRDAFFEVISLKETAQKFADNQNYLGDLVKSHYADLSIIKESYFSDQVRLQERVLDLAAAALAFDRLTLEEMNLALNNNYNQFYLEKLVTDLDYVVIQFEVQSSKKVEQLKKVQLFILLAILATLFISYLFNFVPMKDLVLSNYRALLRSKRKSAEFQFAMDQHALVAHISLEGDIKQLNKQFVNYYQCSENKTGSIADFFANKELPEPLKELIKKRSNSAFWKGELACLLSNGRNHWFETTIVPLVNRYNETNGFIVVQNDIQERKQTEIALNTLRQLSSDENGAIKNKYDAIFKLGKQLFDLSSACIIEVKGNQKQPIIVNTSSQQLSEEFVGDIYQHCSTDLISGQPAHAKKHNNDSNELDYFCAPLFIDNHYFGALVYLNQSDTKVAYSDSDIRILMALANWISKELLKQKNRKSLIEQQEMLLEIGEQAKIGAWEFTSDSNELIMSKTTQSLLGIEACDDWFNEFSNVIAKNRNVSSFSEILKKVLETGKSIEFEIHIDLSTDKIKVFYFRAARHFTKDNDAKVIGSIQDITDKVEANHYLEQTNDRLAFILESTSLGVWDWEIETGQVEFNERWAGIIGYKLSELEPIDINTWMNVAHPDDLERSSQALNKHWQGETEYYICEARMRHKDGHWVWVLDTGKVVEWFANGQPKRMIGTHIDISESKLHEQAIAYQNQRMSVAADSAGIGVWEFDLITNELNWDDWMFKLYGITKECFSGAYDAWENGVHPDDIERAAAELQAAIAGKDKFDTQFRIKWPDGTIRYLKAFAIVVKDDNDQPKSMIGVNYDVTDRVNTEQELIETTKLAEAAVTAKNEFLASMSHEIRTPMNGVIGMLDLLADTTLDQEQNQKLEIANTSAHSLLGLINDILDYSKIEADKLTIEKRDVDLYQLVSDLGLSLAHQAEQKQLSLLLDTSELNNRWVIGDNGRIKQIITNLIANALKFTDNGSVTLKLSDIAIDGELKLTIDVIDTGIGIADKDIDTLFENFSQVDSSASRKYQGAGLGLAIVKKLCRLMNGDILVNSQLNVGSHFSAYIRVDVSQFPEQLSHHTIEPKNVLIVDDNYQVTEIIKNQLMRWGINAYTTASDSLLESLHQYDLCIVNIENFEYDIGKVTKLFDENKLYLMSPVSATQLHQGQQEWANLQVLYQPITPLHLYNLFVAGSVDAKTEIQIDSQRLSENNPKVLLVEDNRINQMVAGGILKKLNLTFDVAANGIETIELLKRNGADYSMIFMDCQMPEMDGYEATKIIRSGGAGNCVKDILIIAMTANAMKGDREKCLDSGMDEYIAKPISYDKVGEMLEKCLSKQT